MLHPLCIWFDWSYRQRKPLVPNTNDRNRVQFSPCTGFQPTFQGAEWFEVVCTAWRPLPSQWWLWWLGHCLADATCMAGLSTAATNQTKRWNKKREKKKLLKLFNNKNVYRISQTTATNENLSFLSFSTIYPLYYLYLVKYLLAMRNETCVHQFRNKVHLFISFYETRKWFYDAEEWWELCDWTGVFKLKSEIRGYHRWHWMAHLRMNSCGMAHKFFKYVLYDIKCWASFLSQIWKMCLVRVGWFFNNNSNKTKVWV